MDKMKDDFPMPPSAGVKRVPTGRDGQSILSTVALDNVGKPWGSPRSSINQDGVAGGGDIIDASLEGGPSRVSDGTDDDHGPGERNRE